MKTQDLDALISYTEEATDHYAEHLAEVNKETDVVATEDIYNKHGVLVARRGARIDHGAAKRLAQHKLLRPIEEQVELKDSLDNRFLYESVGQLLKKYPDLGTVHAALAFEQDSRDLLLGLPLHSLIVQKLTVLSRQLPDWFEKAVFCAWLVALVLRQLGADRATASAGLVAGFTHDLGFLHLPPAVINKKEELNPEEWRALQSHVVVGQVFLSSVPGLDPRVARAVLEHHERSDGTGYPVGKLDGDLELLSKVLGMADSLQAIRVNRFAAHDRTLGDAVPYLQMNDTTHSDEVYRAMSAILRRSGLQPKAINPHGSTRVFADHLASQVEQVRDVAANLNRLLALLLERERERKSSSLAKVLAACVNNVLTKSISAGLEGEEALRWLAQCEEGEQETLATLNEMDLIIAELMWHMHNVRRTVGLYLKRECPEEKEICQQLRQLMDEVDATLKQRMSTDTPQRRAQVR